MALSVRTVFEEPRVEIENNGTTTSAPTRHAALRNLTQRVDFRRTRKSFHHTASAPVRERR
jgi:hypothetical protein